MITVNMAEETCQRRRPSSMTPKEVDFVNLRVSLCVRVRSLLTDFESLEILTWREQEVMIRDVEDKPWTKPLNVDMASPSCRLSVCISTAPVV